MGLLPKAERRGKIGDAEGSRGIAAGRAKLNLSLEVKTDSFRHFVLDQLSELGPVTCRAMFGGHGLYSGNVFFGILYRGQLYFRTSESTRVEYERRGMKPFRPNDRQTMKYHEVPASVVENRQELTVWARQSIASARTR